MVHTGVRRGRLATGQNGQCSHPDELRPGGRYDVIVLVHHWDVAKTSASIAQVGSPRPTETTHDVAPWTENSASSALLRASQLLVRQKRGHVPWRSKHWVGGG